MSAQGDQHQSDHADYHAAYHSHDHVLMFGSVRFNSALTKRSAREFLFCQLKFNLLLLGRGRGAQPVLPPLIDPNAEHARSPPSIQRTLIAMTN